MSHLLTNVSVHEATSDNIEQLRELSITCFKQSFADVNSAEDIKLYLQTAFNRNQLLKELNTAGVAFYFIKVNYKAVGYYKINSGTAQNEPLPADHLELERFYILKEFQNKKIGQHVIDYILLNAKEKKYKTVWLGVWENNRAAMRLYARNGFVKFGSHEFLLGNDRQKDLLMKKGIESK